MTGDGTPEQGAHGDGLELRLLAIEGRLAKLEEWASMFAQRLQAVLTLEQRWPGLRKDVLDSLRWDMKNMVKSRIDEEIAEGLKSAVRDEMRKLLGRI